MTMKVVQRLTGFLNTDAQSSSRQRPRVPGLQRDIEVLKAELLKFISELGIENMQEEAVFMLQLLANPE
ncbi:hypothetical protein ACFX13_004534 [Malus domestica]